MPGLRRRIWILLAMIVAPLVLGLGAFLTQAPREPAPRVRHEDLNRVSVEDEPAAVFEWYRLAVSRFGSWQFQDSRRLMRQLDQVSLPADIGRIARDLGRQGIDIGSLLESADARLRQATELIAAGRAGDARLQLDQLGLDVRRGQVLFEDLVEGFGELARRSGVEALAPDAPRRRAYEELQRVAARAKALLLAYGAIAADPASVAAVARLLPYETRITLLAPAVAYPGRPFIVSGAVREQAPTRSTGRLLVLSLDEQVIATLPVGPFRRDLVAPEGVLPAPHLLSAAVSAQGRYLGATARRDIQVTRAVPVLRVRVPRTALAPGALFISGTASSTFGPVARAAVRVEIGSVVRETRTSEAGEYGLKIDLPGAWDLVGSRVLTVRLVPGEPWHAPVDSVNDIFVINLVRAGLSAAIVAPVLGLAFVGTLRRRRAGKGARPLPAHREFIPAVPPPQPAGAGLSSPPRERLLILYLKALQRVETATGLAARPSATLREYARAAEPLLRSQTFARMTALAEQAFYSPRPATIDPVAQMNQLLTRLDEELAGVAS